MNKIISKKRIVVREQLKRNVEIDKVIKGCVIDELRNVKHYLSQTQYRFVKINLFLRPIYVIKKLKHVVRIYSKPSNLIENDDTFNYIDKDLEDEDMIVVMAILNADKLWFNIKTTGKEGWILLTDELIKSMKLF